jgi:hypothetical protein
MVLKRHSASILVLPLALAACATAPSHTLIAGKGKVASITAIPGNQRMVPVPQPGGVVLTVPMGAPNSWIYTVDTSVAKLAVRSFSRFDVGTCVEIFTSGATNGRTGVLEPAEATVKSAQGCK